MKPNLATASSFWSAWEDKVKADRQNFAKSPLYVEQMSQTPQEFQAVAETVTLLGQIDPDGKTRDAQFGGRLVETCLGPVTRMWLDSNIEYHFLKRHLPTLAYSRVLDIGAGYGRFAATLAQFVLSVTTVDAIPISTEVSREYLGRFAPSVDVLSIDQFTETFQTESYDLAINIHSWNECTKEQVENWIKTLVHMKVPHLFTVSHGQLNGEKEKAYYTWQIGHPSFRPILEFYYDLVAEECLGLTNHPHALWKLKANAMDLLLTPKKPLVMIGTPLRHIECNGLMTPEAFEKLHENYRKPIQALLAATDLPFRFCLFVVGGGGVAKARNTITNAFLESEADVLLFHDYDLIPDPTGADHVKLVTRLFQNGLKIVGGLYTIRSEHGHWVINLPDAAGPLEGWGLRVLELGTGFKAFHRSAFETVAAKNPWLEYQDDDTKQKGYGFFSMGPVKDEQIWPGRVRWLTEDYWLDWLTRDAGIVMVADVTIQLRHLEEGHIERLVSKDPLIQKKVKALEKQLGTTLFIRTQDEIFPKEFPPVPAKQEGGKELDLYSK